jgi:hypothetical protein
MILPLFAQALPFWLATLRATAGRELTPWTLLLLALPLSVGRRRGWW